MRTSVNDRLSELSLSDRCIRTNRDHRPCDLRPEPDPAGARDRSRRARQSPRIRRRAQIAGVRRHGQRACQRGPDPGAQQADPLPRRRDHHQYPHGHAHRRGSRGRIDLFRHAHPAACGLHRLGAVAGNWIDAVERSGARHGTDCRVMSETLKVIRSRLTAAQLEVTVQCGQDAIAAARSENPTIVDMLGRQLHVSKTTVTSVTADGRGIVQIDADAPITDPESDPPSYLLSMSGSSAWFAPAAPRALPQDGAAGKPPPGAAAIDYLGRDYSHFVAMMRARVAQIVEQDSAWALDHPADPMTTILEVLAYAGDHLSFRQDAAGTESYLTTARRRLSLRRHGRLRDYAVDDGCNARTALAFVVNASGVLRAGLQVVTLQPGQIYVNLPADPALVASSTVFETMHRQSVSPALNDLGSALAQVAAYVLPAGAITLTLQGGASGSFPVS